MFINSSILTVAEGNCMTLYDVVSCKKRGVELL